MRRLPMIVLGVALALSAAWRETSAQSRSVVPIPGTLKVIEPAYVDRSAPACRDFFAYANGAWLKHDTIPAAYSYSGVAREMADRNELVVRSVLEDAMKARASLPGTSTEAKLGTFYASCMDSTKAEQAGANPIRAELARIDAIGTREQLVHEIGVLHTMGVDVLFQFGPEPDFKDAAHYIAAANQGGLGMPDRDYYVTADAQSDSLRKKYVAHVTRSFVLAGEPVAQATADAARVMALETELAKASFTQVQLRDPNAVYHKTSLEALDSMAPAVDWPAYFRTVGLTRPIQFANVAQPQFIQRASALVGSVPLNDWKAYLRYHLISTAAPWLSGAFANEDFAYTSLFSGTKEMLPRWKRCLRAADAKVGEALGQAYVAKTFSREARAQAKQVIDDIRASFAQRLGRLTWMSDSTRRFALAKLAAMNEKVGYPDRWRDYSALDVSDGSFVQNVFNANAFEWHRVINRPGQPVDRSEWEMTVPTVNAYYNPLVNEMVFPAGALLPQTFDASGDIAGNYGSLGGSWAGHELTHGFDDEGRHFDAQGNLRDWWAPADSVRFNQQAALMVSQFAGYVQVDTFHVNGKLTLGENIADYGGLLTAYDAMERALDRTGKRDTIDGFTPEQRFFLAYAQSFRQHNRSERLRTRVTVDPHSPEEWRTNGPLSDMPAFARAFNCKPGDPMVRPSNLVPQIW